MRERVEYAVSGIGRKVNDVIVARVETRQGVWRRKSERGKENRKKCVESGLSVPGRLQIRPKHPDVGEPREAILAADVTRPMLKGEASGRRAVSKQREK
jgi:hypothetical protein